jgi:hypothetical protein
MSCGTNTAQRPKPPTDRGSGGCFLRPYVCRPRMLYEWFQVVLLSKYEVSPWVCYARHGRRKRWCPQAICFMHDGPVHYTLLGYVVGATDVAHLAEPGWRFEVLMYKLYLFTPSCVRKCAGLVIKRRFWLVQGAHEHCFHWTRRCWKEHHRGANPLPHGRSGQKNNREV